MATKAPTLGRWQYSEATAWLQARSWAWAAFAGALGGGAALRFWDLATKPDWQYDETVYTRVAANVLRHGTLNEHLLAGRPWTPFLYQPPFYFLILSRWFALVGVGITQARVLGVLMSLAMVAVLFRLVWRIHGERVALFALVPIVYDGWMMYIERASYMENTLMVVIVAGFLLYQRALDHPTWPRFVAAGAMLGFAAVFKHTGAYVILAVALCWLIIAREHRRHLALLGTALAVVGLYVLLMVHFFDYPGHDWYTQQTMVQLRRTFGLQSSGGTLTSPAAFVHLITAQYRVFIPSLLVATCGFGIALRRLGQCYRVRNWVPLRSNALLFSWLAAGFLIFGLSALKFPQYFALILIPLYAFFWTELAKWDRPARLKFVAVALAVVLGFGSFYLRVIGQNDNPFKQVQAYTASSIPRGSVVVTEETIGDLIQQPWCRVEQVVDCPASVTYAITWKTYLQSSFKLGGPDFGKLMQGAVRVKSFPGFNGTATVWRLR
jgi:4-amino-4-deoxy-L-arabinose transferase-like glycosyltransferase